MFDWLYWIFGKILFGIDWAVFHTLGIHNTGLCIILLTIVIYLIMYPLNSKQQKSSRLMSRINPEIQEIQKKYKGKKDQASQMKMNEETQAVYARFGGYTNHPYGWVAFIIPVLAVLLQFINTKLLQTNTNTDNNGDSMAQSMKMMNYVMPFMSGFFCLSLNMGIGLYWITGSLFRIVQAIIINHKMDKLSMEEIIEKNKEKAAKKTAKLEERNRQMEQYSKTRTASIKTASSYQNRPDNPKAGKSGGNSSQAGKKVIREDFEQGIISSYAHMLSGGSSQNKGRDNDK